MDKTHRTELRRVFLLKNLPEPLTRASRHWQIFDNYIENTRLRLRSIRIPETKQWIWILQQKFPLEDVSNWQVSEIYLNETEHAAFEIFEGREVKKNERVETNEVRKNRYFHDFSGGKQIEIDLFLGELWGLITATVYFEEASEMNAFESLPFAVAEITTDEFFFGANLVGKTFADVQNEFGKNVVSN
jgi:CYTH domain-containing protein